MKTDELKLRVIKEAKTLVDIYFGEDTFIDRMSNTTLKILIEQNQDKLNDIFKIFEKSNGEIDAETIINQYAEQMTEDGIRFDIKDYVKSDLVKSMIPNKSLIINKEDILKILK